jgi:dCMP deaminase
MFQKQHKIDIAYIKMSQVWAELSHATRKKVGALIVKNNTIISDGFNGTPSGFENECEIAINNEDGSFREYQTKWYVLHAEANAILKVAKSSQSTDGATLYVTYSPCKDCSKLIVQSGIKRVIYGEEYRDLAGLVILREAGVDILKLDI